VLSVEVLFPPSIYPDNEGTSSYTVSYPHPPPRPTKKPSNLQRYKRLELCENKPENVRTHVTQKRVRVTILAVEIKKGLTYSVCVSVALATQHEMRMRSIILSSVVSPALPYFPTLSHKWHDFRGGGGGGGYETV
jgi:hypothetical protein